MDKTELTPDDMSDFFAYFRVPTPLYVQWTTYASKSNMSMKTALTNLLAKVAETTTIPAYDTLRLR